MAHIDITQVQFHYLNRSFYFPNRTKLKFFLLERLHKEGFLAEALNYIFCADEYLLGINKQYLNHDTYTDIITFPLSPKGVPLVSDIYISTDRVRDNAAKFDTTFTHELHRVIFHGLLHLCGFNDKSEEQARQMKAKEDQYLRLYFRST